MTSENEERRWTMVRNREFGGDDHFVYAVRSTGVFCRSGCSSRTPKRENVEFYDSAELAAAAGYRACKRCRPDRPGPEAPVAERSALVLRACRRILAAETAPSLKELADEAGLSPNHFHRIFKTMTGITPKNFSRSVQADRFLAALERGSSITAAIYDAGFSSPARAYDAVADRTVLTPTQIRRGAPGIHIGYTVITTYLGPTLIAVTEKGICSVLFDEEKEALLKDLAERFPAAQLEYLSSGDSQLIRRAILAIEKPELSSRLPLDIVGTVFQRQVWEALREVPLGTTASYGEIAERIGDPKAARAVAGACAKNKIALFIPCHRIIRSNGELGGYRWGLDRKSRILEKELAGGSS